MATTQERIEEEYKELKEIKDLKLKVVQNKKRNLEILDKQENEVNKEIQKLKETLKMEEELERNSRFKPKELKVEDKSFTLCGIKILILEK